jgi:hypothetical protein
VVLTFATLADVGDAPIEHRTSRPNIGVELDIAAPDRH